MGVGMAWQIERVVKDGYQIVGFVDAKTAEEAMRIARRKYKGSLVITTQRNLRTGLAYGGVA